MEDRDENPTEVAALDCPSYGDLQGEVFSLKVEVGEWRASAEKWKRCFDKVHNLVCEGQDLTPYEVIEAVERLVK